MTTIPAADTMTWLATSPLVPSLPPHCEPVNDSLVRLSSVFHTCIPTPLALLSTSLGALSIVAWLFAQLPQIYKNWRLGSTAGLSLVFLVEWFLGDLSNLFGAIFTHQATWQVAIGIYYVFVDLCLVLQWMWYEVFQNGHHVVRMQRTNESQSGDEGWRDGEIGGIVIEGMPALGTSSTASSSGSNDDKGLDAKKTATRPRIIFRQPTFQRDSNQAEEKPASGSSSSNGKVYRVGPSSMPSPSPRTVLLIACLVALARASPISPSNVDSGFHVNQPPPTMLENAGTILSWMSTLLYLGSRLPQLLKNWRRKSTAGLSPHLFMAAFCGNLFYSAALLTNPCAWNDFGPFGGGGWAGSSGSDREQWVLAALPFFLGAAGVLGMDGCVGVQFLAYGDGNEKVVDIDEEVDNRWHWRRISGWMRGWSPGIGETNGPEREALVQQTRTGGAAGGYGAL